MSKKNNESTMHNAGIKRVEALANRRHDLHQYFAEDKEQKIKQVNDYIFNSTEESGLEQINADFEEKIAEIDKNIRKAGSR